VKLIFLVLAAACAALAAGIDFGWVDGPDHPFGWLSVAVAFLAAAHIARSDF